MKKLLPFFSIAVVLVACSDQPETQPLSASAVQQQAPAFNPDTIGLAAFQEWKAQHELADEKQYNEETHYTAVAPVKKAKKVYPATVRKSAKAVSPAPTRTANPESRSGNTVAERNDGAVMNTETSDAAKAPEKKGWSKAAKGTAIGAGTGAAVGAVISKNNRVVGGVIGGVVGGAVGYGIGRGMDKRDGRY